MKIEIDSDLLEQLRTFPKAERQKIGTLLEKVRESFGKPHEHGGIGLRSLGHGVYECRQGLDKRLVFTAEQGSLCFHFIGNHDEVKRFLKKSL